MAPTVSSSLGDFMKSVGGIGTSIVHAFLGVFYSIFALGQALFTGVLQFGQSVIKLGLDVCQGVVGFVAANFFVILVLGGGYYWYTQNQQAKGGRSLRSKK